MAEVRDYEEDLDYDRDRTMDEIFADLQLDSQQFISTCRELGIFSAKTLKEKFPKLTDKEIGELERQRVLIAKIGPSIFDQIDRLMGKHSQALGEQEINSSSRSLQDYLDEENEVFQSRKFTLNPEL